MERDELEARLGEAHAAAGYDEVMRLVLTQYGPELLGFLGSMLGDEDRARDALGAAVEGMWAALPAFERRCTFRTWAYAIARRTALGARRARRHERLDTARMHALEAVARTETRPYQKTESKERLRALRAGLDEPSRTLLTLRLDREMTWEEIARVLDDATLDDEPALRRAAARTRKRFERLKEQLRATMEAHGWLRTDA